MLVRKLATALVTTLSGEIQQASQHFRARKAAKKRLSGGRESVLEIYAHVITSRYTTKLDGLPDIVSIMWPGESQKGGCPQSLG